jgi:hypothetical protein
MDLNLGVSNLSLVVCRILLKSIKSY